MTAVLREIVKNHKLHNQRIQFPYFNSKECTLVPTPKLDRNSYHNFKQHKYCNHQIHFMEETLEQIGADCGDVEEQKHEAATIVSTYLAKEYKGSFLLAAKIFGVNINSKMSKYVAGAMWTAAGISKVSSRIMCRHLTATFGTTIQVPMKSITGLGSGFVLPRFGTYHYDKEAGKKKEEINYWVSNLSKVVSTDIDRVLNTNENKQLNVTFGYPSKGVLFCIQT